MTDTTLEKHSVTISGHPTSITLEPAFWQALREIATASDCSVNTLISRVDESCAGNLSSALRVYILEYYKGG
jgi:predicted DNA-binding ribbon-helix-helix protein